MRFLFANGDDERTIQLQRLDCGPSGRRVTDEPQPVPPEMIVPLVCPWVKQATASTGFRIFDKLTGTLTQRTGNTGKGKVIGFGRSIQAIRGYRDNVIDVKGSLLPGLSQTAIFAAPGGSVKDQLPQLRRSDGMAFNLD